MFLFFFYLFEAESASATSFVVSSSASIKKEIEEENQENSNLKIVKLTFYLKKHNSPLENYAGVIIRKAEKYNLDWRLVTAISGVESTFGKRIPFGSYNAYGWANGDYNFKSWEDSIEIVSKTLREKYIDKGADNLQKIARIYAPPSVTWAGNVNFFINQIDGKPIVFEN